MYKVLTQRSCQIRDPRFTSRFLEGLRKLREAGSSLADRFSILSTDGDTLESVRYQTLEDMLRSCAVRYGQKLDDYMSGVRILEGPEMIEVTNEMVRPSPGKKLFKKLQTRSEERFGIKGKLSPRFIGPFEILDRVGEVSYRLALPPQLSHVHNVFYVSLLRGQSYEEQYDPLCQNPLEESSRAGSYLGDRGVYTDFLSSFSSMIWNEYLTKRVNKPSKKRPKTDTGWKSVL
ncbi:hypothetical protein Tco_0057651 [Tanacetum coccineum]